MPKTQDHIAYCGFNCIGCPVFMATKQQDSGLKERLAQQYSTKKVPLTRDDINCKGCKSALSAQCKMCTGCQIKACAVKNKAANCGVCGQYPCAIISSLFKVGSVSRNRLDTLKEAGESGSKGQAQTLKAAILPLKLSHLPAAAQVIAAAFSTVAKQFGLTQENCPSYGAFIKTQQLEALWHSGDGTLFYGLFLHGELMGTVLLTPKPSGVFELEKLAVHPNARYGGYGQQLLTFAKHQVCSLGGKLITIGVIEDNTVLKNWYLAQGFVHTGTAQFETLPFTVGFMQWRAPK